ncbi:universal stress protein [Amycolatopsis sp. CA-230715]|uniref:universal stress protein n=1 Tax=Amycolatopsis sp. CA-230715 TaxID=2745196 RepID=UPI001C03A2CD|nr:universal stress protein [Amycolatopsis sp. CA-230715]QWF77995.1 Universal stress protein [Amycolatopsis sp. CA-230715]
MSGPTRHTVVAGIDGSESAARAALWAADEAVRHGLPLRLVHVYTVPRTGLPGLVGPISAVRERLADRGSDWLADAKKAVLATHPGLVVETATREWNPVSALVQESGLARVLVVGSRGLGGFTGLLVGSTAVAVAAHARCPLMVVRGRTPVDPPPGSGAVVVGTDGSAESDAALAFAFEEAASCDTELIAVRTWNDVIADGTLRPRAMSEDPREVIAGLEAELAAQLAGWRAKFPGVAVTAVVVRGRPVRTLLEYGESARLVVVGNRGRGGFTGMLLGSTSQALIAHAPCPVAVVRPDGAR